MSRLLLAPQYPSNMRYQSWWMTMFHIHLACCYDEVIVLGQEWLDNHQTNEEHGGITFAPLNAAIEFEQAQVKDYLEIVNDTDTLFMCDISYPGFFSNVLYHKPLENAFAFCHATSANYLDYFDYETKFPVETAHSKLYKKVFVATNYHKEKLENEGWDNIECLHALPNPPLKTFPNEDKSIDVVTLSRPCDQKRNEHEESHFRQATGITPSHNTFDNWEDYYKYIGQAKVVLITANEDTYGYQIIDAIINNTIPIAPDRNCYSELLPKEYLYRENADDNNIVAVVKKALNGELPVPRLKNEDFIEAFFKNLSGHMRVWSD